MKWSKRIFSVLLVFILCFTSFESGFFVNTVVLQSAKATVNYDRNAAVSFVQNYYNKVYENYFDNVLRWNNTTNQYECWPADCAHFVSGALAAGYIPVGTTQDGAQCSRKPSYTGFLSSWHLLQFLMGQDQNGNPVSTVYAERLSYIYVNGNSNWQSQLVSFMQGHIGSQYAGDVIFFPYTDSGGHVCLYLGDGRIAQHSFGNSFTVDTLNQSCIDCTTCKDCNKGWGSIANYNSTYGIIDFVNTMGESKIESIRYYHINTGTVTPPTITVTSPTNGTVWNVGETKSITWTVSGDTSHIDHFILNYGTNGSCTQYRIDTTSSASRSCSWTIPNTPSTQCKIGVWANDASNNNLAFDDSDGLFTIATPSTAPTITTSSPLPSGIQNQYYSTSFSAIGGATPYTWSKTSGTFPSGLSLSSSATLSGTPTNSGDFSFRIRVTGNNSLYSEKDFTLHINTASGEPKSIHTWLYGLNDQDIYSYDVDIKIDSFLSSPSPSFLYFWALCVYFNDGSAAHGGLQWASGGKKANWGGYGLVGGTQSIVVNYPWDIGRYYRYRVWRLSQQPDGSWEWGFWILDYSTNIETYVGKVTSWGSLINNVLVFTETGYGVQCDTPTVQVRWKNPKYNSVSGGTNLIPNKGKANYNGTCLDPHNTDQRLISTNSIEFIHLTNTTRTTAPNTYLFQISTTSDSIGIFRPSNNGFYLRSSTGTVTMLAYLGNSLDLPIIGDWDGNGKDDIGVFRPSNNAFFLRSSTGTVPSPIFLGNSDDKPIIGKW